MITAIVFVKADVARIPEVAEAIAALDGRQRGLLRDRPDRPDRAGAGPTTTTTSPRSSPTRLNKVPGVTATETHIAFRAYSQHDLESAFSLGLD